ncbi:MAG: hypothetical protein JSU70_19615 [Phycisphaerales bacterium]|nr:MAG: hypothetical protein JSU70_19615 [Phycisphaerales bacterium]
MDESGAAEDKKQKRQKPPLSVGRIAREILAGTALGLAALLVAHVTATAFDDGGCFGVFGFLAMFVLVFPPLNGLGSAVGVYFVGSRGKQTGSFPATLVGGFLGGLVAALLYLYASAAGNVMSGIEKIVLWVLISLIPPILATLGFNLTRRYKQPPSS